MLMVVILSMHRSRVVVDTIFPIDVKWNELDMIYKIVVVLVLVLVLVVVLVLILVVPVRMVVRMYSLLSVRCD